jgi:hypothetical protein
VVEDRDAQRARASRPAPLLGSEVSQNRPTCESVMAVTASSCCSTHALPDSSFLEGKAMGASLPQATTSVKRPGGLSHGSSAFRATTTPVEGAAVHVYLRVLSLAIAVLAVVPCAQAQTSDSRPPTSFNWHPATPAIDFDHWDGTPVFDDNGALKVPKPWDTSLFSRTLSSLPPAPPAPSPDLQRPLFDRSFSARPPDYSRLLDPAPDPQKKSANSAIDSTLKLSPSNSPWRLPTEGEAAATAWGSYKTFRFSNAATLGDVATEMASHGLSPSFVEKAAPTTFDILKSATVRRGAFVVMLGAGGIALYDHFFTGSATDKPIAIIGPDGRAQ